MKHWRSGLLATGGAFAILAIVLVVVAALRVRNLPAPLSAATAAPMSTPAPINDIRLTAVTTPTRLVHPALLDVEHSVQLALPVGWQQVSLDVEDLQDRLQSITLTTPNEIASSAVLLSNVGREAVVAIARLVDADNATTTVAAVTVSAIARNALTLDGYLASVERSLLMRGIEVHAINLDGTLRSDGLPVATIHYSLAEHELDGYQVIAYDRSLTTLIVFTFTAPTSHHAGLLPKYHEVVRSTTF